MRPNDYQALCLLAGSDLLRPVPAGFVIGSDDLPDDVCTAVYVVEGRDGDILYVGSTCRSDARAVANRIGEHLGDLTKRIGWDTVYVVPLRVGTPLARVRGLEALVAVELGPMFGQRHPAL